MGTPSISEKMCTTLCIYGCSYL